MLPILALVVFTGSLQAITFVNAPKTDYITYLPGNGSAYAAVDKVC